MRFIKQILFLFFMPVVGWGQTVHIDGDRIAYNGTVKVVNASKDELYERAKVAMHNVKWDKPGIVVENKNDGLIAGRGKIRLVTPYNLIRTVEYLFEISVEDGKYKYSIDSVQAEQVERGGQTTRMSSGKLLKGVEETGKVSVETEKILNEMDMNFQKLIALVNADMKRSTVARNDAGVNN